jgi:hypothetical protein
MEGRVNESVRNHLDIYGGPAHADGRDVLLRGYRLESGEHERRKSPHLHQVVPRSPAVDAALAEMTEILVGVNERASNGLQEVEANW